MRSCSKGDEQGSCRGREVVQPAMAQREEEPPTDRSGRARPHAELREIIRGFGRQLPATLEIGVEAPRTSIVRGEKIGIAVLLIQFAQISRPRENVVMRVVGVDSETV